MPTVRPDMNHIYDNASKAIKESEMIIKWLEEDYLKHTLSYLSDNMHLLSGEAKRKLTKGIIQALKNEIVEDKKTIQKCFGY